MKLIDKDHPKWPLLFQPAEPVTDYAKQVAPYIGEMRRLIEKKQGGYAICAQQIGLPYSFFVWGGRHWKTPFTRICVNPRIEFPEGAEQGIHREEGCMSFPGKRRDVLRWSKATLFFTDFRGHALMETTSSQLLACVWQHEMDHIEGNPLWLADGSENPKFNIKSPASVS